jgi:hypothetical protein
VNVNYFYEQIFSAVRLAGDRAVPKYINRNLLAIVTQKEASNPIDSELDVYLIDEVTGSVIYHTFHRSCGGPVSIVQSENWVVYNYWNSKTLKQEISVLELYDRNFDSQGFVFFC